MKLLEIKIGSFVEIYNERCNIPHLTLDKVSGINRDKEFFEPSKQVGADTSNYKIVPPSYFACNFMHVGRDIVLPVALNRTNMSKYVSPAYTVFKVTDESVILKEYLFMILNSDEKDRLFWFHTDSSVRDGLDWSAFCDVLISVPSIEVQRKYVAVYQGIQKNIVSQELANKRLQETYTLCIENLKSKYSPIPIRDYIQQVKEKNTDNRITLEQGINIDKKFITPQRSNSDLSSRVIVRKGQFAYCTQLNNENVAIAYRTGEDCVVSPVYDVFVNIRQDILLDNYLFLWLIRPEFGRYMYWLSEGTSYEFLKFENLSSISIPIPSIEIQKSVVSIYESYLSKVKSVNKLKAMMKCICPVLIKGAVEEGGSM